MTNQKGFRQKPDPTKGEMAQNFEQRIQGIMNMLQQFGQVLNATAKGVDNLNQQMGVLKSVIEMCDYRSATTVKLLDEKNVIKEDEHEKCAEVSRIKDFNDMSDKDNVQRGAVPAVEGYKAQLGDLVVLRLYSFDALTGEAIPDVSPLRVKFLLGEGRMKLVENELVGVAKGETKEAVVTLGPEYDKMRGKQLKFKMEIFDVLVIPKPPVVEKAPEAELKAPTFEEAKEIIETAEPVVVPAVESKE